MTYKLLQKAILFTSLFVSGVWAQMATCHPGWEWSQNSLGQDPCFIGSTLDASCRGYVSYIWSPLNSTQYYIPPRANDTGDQQCDCNTVMYMFNMACTACQEDPDGIYPWVPYIAACTSVYISQFPTNLPAGTAIPRWALVNITALPNQTYSDALAMSIGRDPEQLPIPITTLSTLSSTSSPVKSTLSSTNTRSSTYPPGPTSSDNGGSGGGTNVGAIVGGVVGSVVPLSILGVGVFLYMRYRGREQRRTQNPGGPTQDRPSMYGPSASSIPFAQYNPSDPATFPPGSPTSTAFSDPARSGRGVYSGAAEV